MTVDAVTLALHRCRFVDYTPSAITALAFPPLPLPSLKGKAPAPTNVGTLAIGHANGNIDLCEWANETLDSQCTQAWVLRKTLVGPYPSKVDSLAFVICHSDDCQADKVPSLSNLRLFSSGGGSELLEWDIERGSVRRTISSQGGSIWCIAPNPASSLLALGCEDGTIRLLSLDHDTLTHYRRFDKAKCRVLSIAWGPPSPPKPAPAIPETRPDESSDDDAEEEVWEDSWLVTGCSDSSLRKWDAKTGRVIDKMGVDKVRGEKTLVWTVGALGDGTIISGDSLGMVKFWDSRTCTQLQSFQAHGADVLCLTIGPEGKSVYTSGVDQKIAQFAVVKTGTTDKVSVLSRVSSRWVQTCSRRLHSHDVRALASWPPYTILPASHQRQFAVDVAPIVASGGLDMSVVLTPAALPSATLHKVVNPLATSTQATFEDSYQRKIAYAAGPSAASGVRVARHARLVLSMRDSGLSVWRIAKSTVSDLDEVEEVEDESVRRDAWESVLEMELNVHTNLVASAISDDGKWLAVSDMYESKLFSLSGHEEGQLIPKRVRDFADILRPKISSSKHTGSLAFCFTPDSSKLVLSTAFSSHVIIVDLGTGEEKPRVLRRFDHHRLPNSVFQGRVIVGRRAGKLVSRDRDQDQNQNADVDMGEPADVSDEKDEAGESENEMPVVANILRMAVSPDGQWLVTSDDRCRTQVYNLDSVQHHGVLPSFRQPVQALAFDPVHPSTLIMAFPNNTLQIYDVEARQTPPWAKDLCNSLPKRLTHAHDPILGVLFDPPKAPEQDQLSSRWVVLWGSTWLCKLPLQTSVRSGLKATNKRRRESMKNIAGGASHHDEMPRELKMITQYRPILLVDFLSAGELVVVERPLVDVLSTLPPAYFKHKYGSS